MSCFVYILKSEKDSRYYVGISASPEERLQAHNRGSSKFTKPFRPWRIVRLEQYDTRAAAVRRESQIKRYKGGEAFKRLLGEVA